MNLSGKDTCARYGRRATAGRRAQLYCIEGEAVTMEEIGRRLDVTPANAYSRLKRAQAQPGAVTWKALGMKA